MFDKPTPFYGFFRKWAVKRTDFAFWGKKIYFHLDNFIKIAQNISVVYRCVAQFGRALRSGRRGRRFKSCHTDRPAAGICLRRFLLPKTPDSKAWTGVFLLPSFPQRRIYKRG